MPSSCTSTAFARGSTTRSAGGVGDPGVRARRPPGRRRQGCDRARLRHGLLLGVACASGRATRRGGHHAGAARDRAADAGRDGHRVRAARGECGGCAAARRLVRPGAFRVRRLDLVRRVQVDPGGSPPAAAGRRAPLPAQLDDLHALRRPRRLARDAAEATARAAPDRLGGRRHAEFQLGHGDLFKVLRDSGFDVLDLVELYAPDEASDADYYLSDAQWAKKWPWEEIWKARKR